MELTQAMFDGLMAPGKILAVRKCWRKEGRRPKLEHLSTYNQIPGTSSLLRTAKQRISKKVGYVR